MVIFFFERWSVDREIRGYDEILNRSSRVTILRILHPESGWSKAV